MSFYVSVVFVCTEPILVFTNRGGNSVGFMLSALQQVPLVLYDVARYISNNVQYKHNTNKERSVFIMNIVKGNKLHSYGNEEDKQVK